MKAQKASLLQVLEMSSSGDKLYYENMSLFCLFLFSLYPHLCFVFIHLFFYRSILRQTSYYFTVNTLLYISKRERFKRKYTTSNAMLFQTKLTMKKSILFCFFYCYLYFGL